MVCVIISCDTGSLLVLFLARDIIRGDSTCAIFCAKFTNKRWITVGAEVFEIWHIALAIMQKTPAKSIMPHKLQEFSRRVSSYGVEIFRAVICAISTIAILQV